MCGVSFDLQEGRGREREGDRGGMEKKGEIEGRMEERRNGCVTQMK